MKKRWIDKRYAAFDSPQKAIPEPRKIIILYPLPERWDLLDSMSQVVARWYKSRQSIFIKWEDFRSWSCKKTLKLQKSLPHSCRRPSKLNELVYGPKVGFCDSMGWDVPKFLCIRHQLWTIPKPLKLWRLNKVSVESPNLEERNAIKINALGPPGDELYQDTWKKEVPIQWSWNIGPQLSGPIQKHIFVQKLPKAK